MSDEVMLKAITSGDIDQVRSLLHGDPSLAQIYTHEGVSAVLLAVYYGHKDIAALLLDNIAELDIFEAAALGKSGRVIDLLEDQADLVNAEAPDGFTPLGLAAFFRHPEAVEALINHGARVNQAARNQTRVQPLHSAAASQHIEIARMLLEAGADANARQQHGFTPIMEAADNGQLEMVQLLMEWRADPMLATDEGQTALTLAEAKGHQDVVNLLKMHA